VTDKENEKPTGSRGKILRYVSFASLAGLLTGIIGGYIYYRFVGCTSGGCAITSNPWMSMLWGALAGYLIGDMFTKKTETPKN